MKQKEYSDKIVLTFFINLTINVKKKCFSNDVTIIIICVICISKQKNAMLWNFNFFFGKPIYIMAVRVVEFSRGGYKIGKIFG